MRIIFCADPLNITRPDSMYEAEVAAAQEVGLPYSLISFEALVEERNAARAIRKVEASPQAEMGIYRGWMLRPEAYERLYNTLANKGISLLNTPAAYRHCHYLPESYAVIQGYTPRSTWLHIEHDEQVEIAAVMETLRLFGEKPVIVKDFVSSKYWEEGDYSDTHVPTDLFSEVAQQVQSRFFTMDVARRRDGKWMIVELGDGQVAGLPERADVGAFYRALAEFSQD